MRLERIGPEAAGLPPARWVGAVLCQDIPGPDGRPALLKGHRLERADLLTLEAAAGEELHLLWLEPGDVDEDTAALRLAAAVRGEGVTAGHPVESQVRLVAEHRGLLRVDATALAAVNAVHDVTVFALADGMPVDAGRTLAGVKVTPLAITEERLAEAEASAARARTGVVSVLPFRPLCVSVIVRERLAEGARQRFEDSLRDKLGWYGGSVGRIVYLRGDVATTRAALERAAAECEVLLAAGVASTDPQETTWRAVQEAGARTVRRGLPVHPGSSYWIADLAGTPVIGVASCGMFSRRTALDLLLTRLFAGLDLDDGFLAGLGHGGLLAGEMAWRFPPRSATSDGVE